MATRPFKLSGTVLCTEELSPQATTVPSPLSAKLWRLPPAIPLERQTVKLTCGDSYDIAQTARDDCLAVIDRIGWPEYPWSAPSYNRPVGLQGQTVRAACSDGCNASQTGRNGADAIRVEAPSLHCAVALECQAVLTTGGDGQDISQANR